MIHSSRNVISVQQIVQTIRSVMDQQNLLERASLEQQPTESCRLWNVLLWEASWVRIVGDTSKFPLLHHGCRARNITALIHVCNTPKSYMLPRKLEMEVWIVHSFCCKEIVTGIRQDLSPSLYLSIMFLLYGLWWEGLKSFHQEWKPSHSLWSYKTDNWSGVWTEHSSGHGIIGNGIHMFTSSANRISFKENPGKWDWRHTHVHCRFHKASRRCLQVSLLQGCSMWIIPVVFRIEYKHTLTFNSKNQSYNYSAGKTAETPWRSILPEASLSTSSCRHIALELYFFSWGI